MIIKASHICSKSYLLTGFFLVIFAGDEPGQQAEHYIIFRSWYDKDPMDGEDH